MIKKEFMFINEQLDNDLKNRIDVLARVFLVKNRKKFIDDYIERNFTKLMGENRPLTSKEVMEMMQISRSTLNRRIKSGKLKPINPDEKNHRFLRSELVENLNSKKGGNYGR